MYLPRRSNDATIFKSPYFQIQKKCLFVLLQYQYTHIIVQRQALVRPTNLDDHRRIAHGTHQKPEVIPRIELRLQNGRREAIFILTVAGQQIPDANIVVRRGRQQLKQRTSVRLTSIYTLFAIIYIPCVHSWTN